MNRVYKTSHPYEKDSNPAPGREQLEFAMAQAELFCIPEEAAAAGLRGGKGLQGLVAPLLHFSSPLLCLQSWA